MGYGGIIGQTVNAFTKSQTFSSTTQALYPSGTTLPDQALALLAQAALYKTITPTAQLGTLAEGSIIYLNENGQPVPFYVAKQGYEPDYNTDRVLVVRKEAVQQGAWNSSGVNTYDGSTIDTWFNQTYLQTLDSDVQTAIGTTQFPYTPGNGNYTVSTLARSIFALSVTELGGSNTNANVEGTALPIASTLAIAYLNGSLNTQWTRSPNTNNTDNAWVFSINGSPDVRGSVSAYGARPAFTLPSNFMGYMVRSSPGLYDLSNNLLLTLPGVQIETGSYTGTGTYGQNNPNRLPFGFVPKIVFVSSKNYGDYVSTQFINPSQAAFSISANTTNSLIVTWNEKTISWYLNGGSQANPQLNASGGAYYYRAIG